jgi:uncharacterized integral membrane protein
VSRARRIVRAVLFTRYDRWEWLLPLALLILLLATAGSPLLIALVGVVLGQQSMRAAQAWRLK